MPGRKKMDIDTALMLAEIVESQKRRKREMGDPNVDGPRENDPMRGLQDQFYRGFNVPPGTEEQKQAYRDAIDQRLYTQGLRERRREEAMAPSTRRLVADALRRGGMAASITPYDVGLGDAAYAAGELIDPEGTVGGAMLAAGGGLLTAGLGSGAILSKAAKEALDPLRNMMLKDPDVEELALLDDTLFVTVDPSASQLKRLEEVKNKVYKKYGLPEDAPPRKVLRDLDIRQRVRPDLTPTVIKENPLNIKFPDDAVRGPRTFGKVGPDMAGIHGKVGPDMADIQSKIRKANLDYGRGTGTARSPYVVDRFVDAAVPAAIGGYVGASAIGALGGFEEDQQTQLLESIRGSTDYGNAFSETMRMNTPDMYNSPEDLNDVGPMLQEAFLKAIQISEQTGMVPIDLTRQIGKLEALQKTKETLEASDDLALQGGFMDPMKTSGFGDRLAEVERQERMQDEAMRRSGFGDRVAAMSQMPSMEDGRSIEEIIRSRDEAVSRAELRDLQRMGIIDSPSLIDREVQFKPSMPIDEGPPMVGPADPTPEQMRQMDATREIVPSMEDFGE